MINGIIWGKLCNGCLKTERYRLNTNIALWFSCQMSFKKSTRSYTFRHILWIMQYKIQTITCRCSELRLKVYIESTLSETVIHFKQFKKNLVKCLHSCQAICLRCNNWHSKQFYDSCNAVRHTTYSNGMDSQWYVENNMLVPNMRKFIQ